MLNHQYPSRNRNQLGFIELQFVNVRREIHYCVKLKAKLVDPVRFRLFIRFINIVQQIKLALGIHLNTAHRDIHTTWNGICIGSAMYVCVCLDQFFIHSIHLLFYVLTHNLCILIARLYSKSHNTESSKRKKQSICCTHRSRFECIILLSKTETINKLSPSISFGLGKLEEWW